MIGTFLVPIFVLGTAVISLVAVVSIRKLMKMIKSAKAKRAYNRAIRRGEIEIYSVSADSAMSLDCYERLSDIPSIQSKIEGSNLFDTDVESYVTALVDSFMSEEMEPVVPKDPLPVNIFKPSKPTRSSMAHLTNFYSLQSTAQDGPRMSQSMPCLLNRSNNSSKPCSRNSTMHSFQNVIPMINFPMMALEFRN